MFNITQNITYYTKLSRYMIYGQDVISIYNISKNMKYEKIRKIFMYEKTLVMT